MNFDPAFTIGNLITILTLVIAGGGFLCKLAHGLAALREELRWFQRDVEHDKELRQAYTSLIESRLKDLECWQHQQIGKQGKD